MATRSSMPLTGAAALAVAAGSLFVAWLESRYLLGALSLQLYVLLLCGVCTALGAWFGTRISRRRKGTAPTTPNTAALASLGISDREAEVLSLLVLGHSNQEIADQLHVSANTVKTHLRHLYEKMGVARRGQAVEQARRLGLVR